MADQPSSTERLFANFHGIKLRTEADALDLIGARLNGCIFLTADLDQDFFDLSNGLAGAVFQKLTNYNCRTAFVIEDFSAYSQHVRQLYQDHRSHPCVRLFKNTTEAIAWLQQQDSQQQ